MYMSKYNSERKTLLEWLDFLMLIFSKLFIVYYWEGRDSTKFSNSKEEYFKTVLFKILLSYVNAVIEINECFFWSFCERQLKALEQFEAKEYSSFQQVPPV